MTVASLQGSLGKLSAFLDGCSRDLTLRRRKEDLTRKRQLALRQVALLILSAMKRVQGLEPKDFFDTAGCPGRPSGSAFSRALHKMAPEFFVRWLKRQAGPMRETPGSCIVSGPGTDTSPTTSERSRKCERVP